MHKATVRGSLAVMALTTALVTSACSGSASNSSGSASVEPIRIALVAPLTGTYAVYGEQIQAAVKYAAAEANAKGGIDGRKVDVYSADPGATAASTVAAVQRLVQQDQAKFVIGTVATPTTLAVMQQLQALDALQIGTQSNGVDLTGKSCVKRFFRSEGNDPMTIASISTWLKTSPEKNWDSIAMDYGYGHNITQAFKQTLEGVGGNLDKELYPPVGTTDFGPYIGNLNGGDGLFIVESGDDGANFYKQALQFGLLKKYKMTIGPSGSIESTRIATLGDQLLGQMGVTLWSRTVDTPQSRQFVSAYTKSTGKAPGDFVGQAYGGMQTLFAGITKAHSVDPGKVATALEGLTYDTLYGTVTMRAADHQALVPIFVGKVANIDGKPGFQVTSTIRASESTPQANPQCKLKLG